MISAFVLGMVIFGSVVWWLIRIRQRRIWFPIARILRIDTRQLPRLTWVKPPWAAFFAFLLTALFMLLFSFQPKQQIYSPIDPEVKRYHVFLDLSPSVSAHLGIDAIVSKVGELWDSLERKGKITLSTSHGQLLYEPSNRKELEDSLRALTFHHSGLKLGSAVKAQVEHLSEVDRLFIFSDRNMHSWDGFHWQYLLEDMDVFFVDLSKENKNINPSNVFINHAQYLSAPFAPTMDWDVEINRSGSSGDVQGKLTVSYRDKSLVSIPWNMPQGRDKIVLRVSWPISNMDEVPSGQSQNPLVWQLQDVVGDSILLDNTFRNPMMGLRNHIIQISETRGEQTLEDSANQLKVILEVLGYQIRRFDHIQQPGPDAHDASLWVIHGGYGGGERFCPASLVDARLEKASQLTSGIETNPLPKVWLSPTELDADYGELCWCYDQLLKSSAWSLEKPIYCKDVTNRDSFIYALKGLGASQVGGSIGGYENSLAWIGTDPASGMEVLAFTIPMKPLISTGINHARLPILVRDLLRWQKFHDSPSEQEGWPRYSDIASEVWSNRSSEKDSNLVAESNVPRGESLMDLANESELPPKWLAFSDQSQKQISLRKDKEDPIPWLRLCAGVLILAMIFEIIAFFVKRLRQGASGQGAAILMILMAGGFADSASARIQFSLLGFEEGSLNIHGISREISQRTSVEFVEQVQYFKQMAPLVFEQPWLWLASPNYLPMQDRSQGQDLIYWLKRGGILIVENSFETELFADFLTKNLLTDPSHGGWRAIPPDHVLMRSFYLIDSLPVCHQQVWKGFEFDGRLAVIAIPFSYMDLLSGKEVKGCPVVPNQESLLRILVNILMVSLATDYKNDQIHLPEILKRLR
jgi:hypothetical protein